MKFQKANKEFYVDNIIKPELDKINHVIRHKDRDKVGIIDGEEGSGKSVLAMQVCKTVDPKFSLKRICFNADQFTKLIKTVPKCSAVLLDEGYGAANSRATLTEVNRALVALGTEMRQRNLFVVICLPTFFDLDKYYALWRSTFLLHVYFGRDGSRGRYIIFTKTIKKLLYLNGKRRYDYRKPQSTYPACQFRNEYVVDEKQYRLLKAEAFKKRTLSNISRKWKGQRDALIKELYHNFKIGSSEIPQRIESWGERGLSQREIQRIVQLGGDVQ